MNLKIIAIFAVWLCLAQISASAQLQNAPKKDTVANDSLKKVPIKLKEVTISSSKPAVQYRLDKTVVNVANMVSAAGANALELLERAPGVIVGQNGELSYMGKSGVTILIDGKPTYLSGDNLAGYLKSLPAGTLEEIELMSNPPSRYEASGTAGIINIKTKKSKAKGFSGTLSSTTGKTDYWRNNESLSLHYYSGKVNIYTNLGYGFSKTNKKLDLLRDYFNPIGQLNSSYIQQAYFRPLNQFANAKLGVDYLATKATTLTLLLNNSFSPSRYNSPVNTRIFDASATLDSIILADNSANSKFKNNGITLSSITKLDSMGKELSFDADYLNYRAENKQTFMNSTFFSSGVFKSKETTLSDLPVNIGIYSLKSDYSQPIKGKGKIEFGAKTSFVKAVNLANYFNLQNGLPVTDANKTNEFSYRENVNAAYLNLRKELSTLSFQIGLRLENTNLKGLQNGSAIKADSAFTQHYTNLFPTAYFSYKLDTAGEHSLSFSYGRRIDRPYYKDLNPFIYIIDKYTYTSGNPNLRPQTTTNYELSWRYKSILSSTVFYNYYKNFQTETVMQNRGIFISTPSNIGKKTTLGINSSLNWKPTKWWDNNIYSELVNLKFSGQAAGSLLNTSTTYYYFETGNQFAIGHGWNAELSAFYISARTIGQFNLDGKSQVSAGLQKKMFQNKGSIKLAVTDLFRDNISSGSVTEIMGASASYRNDFDTRMFSIGLSYNFGGSTKSSQKKNIGGAQGEQNRIRN